MAIPLAPLAPLLPVAARLAPLAPTGGAPLGPQPRRRRRRKKQPRLTPEEEESILGGVMGTVQYLGEMLDKPGRAVRGSISALAGGKSGGGLLNLVPFSDTLGLTDPKKAVSGRDLWEMAGAPRNKPGLFYSPGDAFWDVAGFATEVALDPLTLVTGPLGSLSKQGAAKVAGTGAKRLGTKGDDILKMVKNVVKGTPAPGSQTFSRTWTAIGKQLKEGDRGLAGIKVPFGPQLVTFGAGGKTGALAAKAIDYLAYRGTYNPVPVARGLFSSTAGGQFRGAASRAADMAADAKREAVDQWMNVVPALNKGMKDIEQRFLDMAKEAGAQGDIDTFNEFTRGIRMLEAKKGLPTAVEMATGLRTHMQSKSPAAAIKGTEELAGELHKNLDAYLQLTKYTHERIRELGGDIGVLQDTYVPHFPRRPGDPRILDPDSAKRPGGYYDFEQSRKDYLRNWPGGSVGIHAVAKDKLITATAAPGREAFIEAMQGGDDFAVKLQKIMGKLEPGQEGYAKARLKAYRVFRKEYSDDLKSRLLGKLKEMGVEVDKKASLRGVHKTYLWNKHARKPFDEAAAAGLLDELGLKAHTDALRKTAKVETDAAKVTALLAKADGLDALGVDNGLGRAQYREIGRQAEMQRFFDDGALDRMLSHFRKYPKEVQQKGLFDRRPVEDLFDYYRSMLEKEATLKTAHNYLRGTDAAQVVFRGSDKEAADGVSLAEAWNDAGFKTQGLHKFARDKFGNIADDEIDDFVNDLTIRKGGENVLRNLSESMKPKVQGEVWEFLDKMNATWKGNMTIPFPSFHARNTLSSVWSNWASGELPLLGKDGLLMETIRAWWFALSGRGDYEYLDEMTQIGLFKGHVTRQAEVAGSVADIAGDARTQALGPDLFRGVRDAPYSELLDPRASRGGFAGEARNIAQRGGEKAYAVVEFAARATPYTMFRKQGLAPAQAYRKVMRMQFDYCVDEQTEMLTKRGWLRVDDISADDEALTIDPKTRDVEWQPIEAMNVFPFSGHLTHMTSNRFDAMTTDNHRWLAEGCGKRSGHHTVRRRGETHFATTGSLPKKEVRIIAGGGNPACGAERAVHADQFVRLVGWYITEGWDAQTKYGIMIGQSEKANPSHCQRIRDIAKYYKDLGCTTSEYASRDNGWGPIVTWYFGKGIGERVRTVCPNRQLTPAFLCSLTTTQLRGLYNVLMWADGHCKDGTDIWGQQDSGRNSAFMMLCAMLGRRCGSRDAGGAVATTVYKTKHVYAKRLSRVSVRYEGRVWCPTTPAGTWMARRNGFSYWTGNSELSGFERDWMTKVIPFYTWSRKSIPYTLTKLLERPGGKTAQTIRTMSIQPTEGEYRPSWLREGMSLRMPGGTPEATSFLKQGGIPVEDLNLLTWDNGLPDIGRTAQKMAGMARQGIQAPLEWASGKSLFSGKKTKDARSKIGALARPFGFEVERSVADEILARSPLSRAAAEMAKFTDWDVFEGGRKPGYQVGLNLLSGLKFTTSDTELQRQRDLQTALREDILADPFGREGTHFYTPRRFRGTEDAEAAEELIRRERQAGEILKIFQDDRDAKKKKAKKKKAKKK